MTHHRHKSKERNRRTRTRLARQAWRNFAALNSWKAIFDDDYVQVIRKLDGVDQHSTKIRVNINPARVVANPSLMGWITREFNMDSWADNAAEKIRKTIDNHLADAILSGSVPGYRVGRTYRWTLGGEL